MTWNFCIFALNLAKGLLLNPKKLKSMTVEKCQGGSMTDVPFVVATGCCNYLQAHFLSLESRSSVSQKYRYTDGSGEKHCGVFCKIIAFVCVVKKCCSKKYAEEDQDKEVGTMKKIIAAFPVFCKMKVIFPKFHQSTTTVCRRFNGLVWSAGIPLFSYSLFCGT